MPKNRAVSKAINKFDQSGPYTFDEVKRLAERCYSARNTEGVSLRDSLDVGSFNFPTEEYKKIREYGQAVEYFKIRDPAWTYGTELWVQRDVLPGTPDGHLELIATDADLGFQQMMRQLKWKLVPGPLRLELLKILRMQRAGERKEREEMKHKADEKAKKKRERSPKRKQSN